MASDSEGPSRRTGPSSSGSSRRPSSGKPGGRRGGPRERTEDTKIQHRPQHASGTGSGDGVNRRRPESPKKAKGSGGKIPPPPVIRDEVSFERIEDDQPVERRRRRDTNSIDVSGVKFSGMAASTATKLANRLEDAAVAFEKERFKDADSLLRSIQQIAPSIPEVHELRGLVHYRMGRWERAIKELEQFSLITGSVDQHPVWADCCRARKRWDEVDDLWYALGEASPSPELVEEGRIVFAGSLADQLRLDDAIRVLEKAPNPRRNPKLHHLRRWYVLADLYERSGDLPRSRRLFARIVENEPDFGDAFERQEALS